MTVISGNLFARFPTVECISFYFFIFFYSLPVLVKVKAFNLPWWLGGKASASLFSEYKGNLVLCLIYLHQKVSNSILGQLISQTTYEYDS